MPKVNLTDRFIRSRKPAAAGQRVDIADSIVPGLALRITDRGHKSFVLIARYPSKPRNPTRRALGDYGALTLEKARAKARDWLELIARGADPKMDEARRRATEQRRYANSFAAVAADFVERYAKKHMTKAGEAESVIENEFSKRWGSRPITDIAPQEAAAAIRAIVDRGAPYQAHNAFGYLRRLYNWAIAAGEYGVDASPVTRLRAAEIIGARALRTRTLTDDELRVVWRASDRLGYPYGPLFKLLILTGQRKSEVADMRRREIDVAKGLWTVPAERMKGSRLHEIPLAPAAFALLEELPRWNGGDHVFTTTGGVKSVNGFSKAKARLDVQVDAIRSEGKPKHGRKKPEPMPAWVIHDLRRTVRTHLSALPVQDIVRELVIAHAKPGLHAVYDQHAYRDEKRHCLELWEGRLRGIIKPVIEPARVGP